MPRQELKYKNTKWINIVRPKPAELKRLITEFSFHPVTVTNISEKTQRSQIDVYDNYYFLVWLLPKYNSKLKEFVVMEMNFYIGDDFIVTIHDGKIAGFAELFAQYQKHSTPKQNSWNGGSTAELLYHMLKMLLEYCFPLLDRVAQQIEHIEEDIFRSKNKSHIQEILEVRRNIVDLRRTLQPHKSILRWLLEEDSENHILQLTKYRAYFDNLVYYAQETWDTLDEYKESIDMLQEAKQTLISFAINKIMETLTLISVIILPMSFVAGIFGMNARNIPLTHLPYDFWLFIVISLIAGITMAVIIKWRRWFE